MLTITSKRGPYCHPKLKIVVKVLGLTLIPKVLMNHGIWVLLGILSSLRVQRAHFNSDFILGSNAAHSSDNEATRNRFAMEYVCVASPLSGHRPPLIDNIHASTTSVTDASVHVQFDVLVRPKLRLLPRTKPLDATSQTAILEVTQWVDEQVI